MEDSFGKYGVAESEIWKRREILLKGPQLPSAGLVFTLTINTIDKSSIPLVHFCFYVTYSTII